MSPSRPRRAVLTAAALALAIAASAGVGLGGAIGDAGVATARAMGPLPACRYDNILTTPRAYTSWSKTLVDTILRVPSTYVPPDLVPVSQAGLNGSLQIRAVAIEDLTEMAAAAKAAGSPIAVQSAYRSFNQQKATFDYWVSIDGYSGALKVSARPGHSEHQLGLAIDFKSAAGGPPWEGTDWALSPAGKWMKANAWKYGWLMSYPKGEEATVCYSYEPWHYRYVGRELAATIHGSGLTVREYLWTHFTTAEVPPPTASGQPATSPSTVPSVAPSQPVPDVSPGATFSRSLPPPATTLTPSAPPTAPPTAPAGDAGPGATVTIAAIVIAAVALLLIGAGWAGRRRRAR